MWPHIKGEVAHISLFHAKYISCYNSEKNGKNRCSFAEVIAKINQVSAFLDHPVGTEMAQVTQLSRTSIFSII